MKKALEARLAKKQGSLKSGTVGELQPDKMLAKDGLYYTLFKVPNSGGLYTFVTVRIIADRVVTMTKTVEDLYMMKEAELINALLDNQQ